MEANLVRILLLIALFFLLSGDYSSFVKHLVPGFEDGDEDVAAEQPGAVGVPQPERGPEELQVKPTDESESKLCLMSFHFVVCKFRTLDDWMWI